MVTTFRIVELRQRRKLFLGQTEDFEKALSAANRSGVLAIDIEGNFTRRQLADDVEEPSRREGGSALLFPLPLSKLPRTPTSRSVVVRRISFPLLCRRTLDRSAAWCGADDVLNLLQTFEQLLFRDAEFHEDGNESLRCKAFDFIRQPQSRRRRSALQRAVDERDRLPDFVLLFHPLLSPACRRASTVP
jgi:hypothetical protein